MGYKHMIVLGFLLLSIVAFSGCQEDQTGTQISSKVTLESSVVELINASLDFKKDENKAIVVAEVKYLFHNKVDRTIDTLRVIVEFYDENGNLLNTSQPRIIRFMPPDYSETALSPTNRISYNGANVVLVDHAKIIATEVNS